MSTPRIRCHLIPTSYEPSLDISESYDGHDIRTITLSSGISHRECRLIEKAVNGRWFSPSDPNTGFERHNLIKLTQDSSDISGKTFIIDYSTEKDGYPVLNFFDECNWTYCADPVGNPSVFTEQEWVMDHGEYGGVATIIEHLQHQIFIEKPSNFIGIAGATPSNFTIPYTYIPRVGGYSLNLNENGYPNGGLNFIGNIFPVYPDYNSTKQEWDWDGELNYIFEYSNGKNKIIFSQPIFNNIIRQFPNNPSDTSVYNVYFRGHIYRTNNIHSTSMSGVSESESSVYYAVPHDDIIPMTCGIPRILNTSDIEVSISNSIFHDQGLIAFSPSNYPPSNFKIFLDSYQYHSWIRLANDMTNDLLFRVYIKDSINRIDVYNYDNSTDPLGEHGHITNNTSGEEQTQQELINYTWADIKITNEIDPNPSDPPNLLDFYIDAFPRGRLTGTQDNEQIIQGQGGLVERDRPWDHQEGSRSETDQSCFIRVVKNYNLLYNKPSDSPNNPPAGHNSNDRFYGNPMRQMNAAQAWRIKYWYNNNTSVGTSGKRFLLETSDNIMADAQTGAAITMLAGDILYARIIHILYDGISQVPVTVAAAPKYWSIGIRGDYLSGN